MVERKVEVFLSYCWADENIADKIYDNLIRYSQINIHRDKLDIGHWESIKEYMQSITYMDYTILLISKAYLKSSNCMYEMLEVIRDRKYKNKIFPVVVDTEIYDPIIRVRFVKYWQDELSKLRDAIEEVDVQNLGTLSKDLKQRQDIASNIAEFLGIVADMNNPQIKNISEAIMEKLYENGLVDIKTNQENYNLQEQDIFTKLGINNHQDKIVITDFDINQFMASSYYHIQKLLQILCKQLEEENSIYKVSIEIIDTRSCFYQFYKNGKSIINLKISLNNIFGSLRIGVSNNSSSFASNQSWNGLYSAVVLNENLKLKSMMSMNLGATEMEVEEVVKDIWESYVCPYLYG